MTPDSQSVMQERFLQSTTEVKLNIAEGPNRGPRLWLFHGVGRRWQDFEILLPGLTPHWHVAACDHRGHGRSDRDPGKYLVADHVIAAAEVVRQTADRAVLVGHSLGALVVLGVAAQLPQLVRAGVLLDPPGVEFLAGIGNTPYATMWAGMQRLAGSPDVDATTRDLAELQLPGPRPREFVRLGDIRDAAAIHFLAKCLKDLDPAVLTPPLENRWLDGFNLQATARAVQCPALLVVADPSCGGMMPLADAEALTTALPHNSRVDMPGVGHLVHWHNPEGTLRLVNSLRIT